MSARKTAPARPVRDAFSQRLPYKAAALFFALVLWFFVSAEEPTELEVPVRFAPRLDESLKQPTGAPAFRAVVTGKGRELLKLLATPPTLRPSFGASTRADTKIEFAVSDVRLPQDVEAIVRELRPRTAQLHFLRAKESGKPAAIGAASTASAADSIPSDSIAVRDTSGSLRP